MRDIRFDVELLLQIRSCLSKWKELRVFPSQENRKCKIVFLKGFQRKCPEFRERGWIRRKEGTISIFFFGQITARRGNEDDEKWAKSTSRVINVAISVLRCRVWNITSHGRLALRAHGSVTFPLSYETRKWPRIPPPLLATTMPSPSLLLGGVVKSDTIRGRSFYQESGGSDVQCFLRYY